MITTIMLANTGFPCFLKVEYSFETFPKPKWPKAKGVPLLSRNSSHANLLVQNIRISTVMAFFLSGNPLQVSFS